MPRLDFTVEVEDNENGFEFLIAVQKAFTAIMDLNKWGYTDDECFAISTIDTGPQLHSVKVFDQTVD